MIADGTPIGRGKLLVVHEDASGRIVALNSSSYLDLHPTGPTNVIVVGSYCGTRILAPMFTYEAAAHPSAAASSSSGPLPVRYHMTKIRTGHAGAEQSSALTPSGRYPE